MRVGESLPLAVERLTELAVGDVLRLPDLGRRFATVIDSAVYHVFDDQDRARTAWMSSQRASLAGTTVMLDSSANGPDVARLSSGVG